MLSFSVNMYDNEGDLYNTGVCIWHGDTILRFNDVAALETFIAQLQHMLPEIKETIDM
jgi:hypothetical protein